MQPFSILFLTASQYDLARALIFAMVLNKWEILIEIINIDENT